MTGLWRKSKNKNKTIFGCMQVKTEKSQFIVILCKQSLYGYVDRRCGQSKVNAFCAHITIKTLPVNSLKGPTTEHNENGQTNEPATNLNEC